MCPPISLAPCEDGAPPPFSCYEADNGEIMYDIGSCYEWTSPEATCPGFTGLTNVVSNGEPLVDARTSTDRSVSDTGAVNLRFEAAESERPEGGPFVISFSVCPGDGETATIAAASDQIGLSWNNEGCSAETMTGEVESWHADPSGTSERHVCGAFTLSCTDPGRMQRRSKAPRMTPAEG